MTADNSTKPNAMPTPEKQDPVKPINPAAIKKAIALGKEMGILPDVTKADVARKMYELISGESREVIIQAFVEGANLTPKGAQTYFYNCRRKAAKSA